MKLRRTLSSALALVILVSGLAACSSKPEPVVPQTFSSPNSVLQAVEAATQVTFAECGEVRPDRLERRAEGVLYLLYVECEALAQPDGPFYLMVSFGVIVMENREREPVSVSTDFSETDLKTWQHEIAQYEIAEGHAVVQAANWTVYSRVGGRGSFAFAPNDPEYADLQPAYDDCQATQEPLLREIATKLGGTLVTGE